MSLPSAKNAQPYQRDESLSRRHAIQRSWSPTERQFRRQLAMRQQQRLWAMLRQANQDEDTALAPSQCPVALLPRYVSGPRVSHY
jgi:hypothetical protein